MALIGLIVTMTPAENSSKYGARSSMISMSMTGSTDIDSIRSGLGIFTPPDRVCSRAGAQRTISRVKVTPRGPLHATRSMGAAEVPRKVCWTAITACSQSYAGVPSVQ